MASTYVRNIVKLWYQVTISTTQHRTNSNFIGYDQQPETQE